MPWATHACFIELSHQADKTTLFAASCRLLKGQNTEAKVSFFGSSLKREQFLKEVV